MMAGRRGEGMNRRDTWKVGGGGDQRRKSPHEPDESQNNLIPLHWSSNMSNSYAKQKPLELNESASL